MGNKEASSKGSHKNVSPTARDEVIPGFIVSSIVAAIPFLGLMVSISILTEAEQITRLVQQLVTLLTEGLCIAFFWRRIDPSSGKSFATAIFAVGMWAFMGGCLITVFGLRFGGMGDLARNVALLGSGVLTISGFFYALAWAQSQSSRYMVQTHSMIATSIVLAGFAGLMLKNPRHDQGAQGETLSAKSLPSPHGSEESTTDDHHGIESDKKSHHSVSDSLHHESRGSHEPATQGNEASALQHKPKDSHKHEPEKQHQDHGTESSHHSTHEPSSSPGHRSQVAHADEEEAGKHPQSSDGGDEDDDSHGGRIHAWSYEGHNNPSTWGKLKPDWQTCSSGREQSPVNIPKGAKEVRHVVTLSYSKSPMQLTTDGELLQAFVSSGGHAIINGKPYSLKRLDFHSPSEHHVAGASYPLEIQFVHEDTQGHTAIISAFVEKGSTLPMMGKILTGLPLKAGQQRLLQGPISLEDLLPRDHAVKAHQYRGSLTIPPCTEGVLWTVLRKPLHMSSAQLALFSSHFAGSNRPLQDLGKRTMKSQDVGTTH